MFYSITFDYLDLAHLIEISKKLDYHFCITVYLPLKRQLKIFIFNVTFLILI